MITTAEQQVKIRKKRKQQKQFEIAKKDFLGVEDKRPDAVADEIIKKINEANFQAWEVKLIVELIRKAREKSNPSEREIIMEKVVKKMTSSLDLTKKEKQHFLDLPPENILYWFKKYLVKDFQEKYSELILEEENLN